MKVRVSVAVVAVIVALVAGVALLHAQQPVIQVGFAFVAGGQEMPAGKYAIEVTGAGPIVLRGPATSGLLPVITSLGRHDKDPDPELVFDKVGGKLLLSEIWLPGKDGYLILGTKEAHEHAVVGGSNPRK